MSNNPKAKAVEPPKTSMYYAVQRYVAMLESRDIPITETPPCIRGRTIVYEAMTDDRKIVYFYQPLSQGKAKELVVITGKEDTNLASIIKDTAKFPDRKPVDSAQNTVDEPAISSLVSHLSALYNGWSGAPTKVEADEYSVRVIVDTNPFEEKIGKGGIVRRRALSATPNFATQMGESYTHSKIESIIMHTLAANLEELVSFGYNRLYSVQGSTIFDLGTQDALWPHLTAQQEPLDDNERRFLGSRAKEIWGENIPIEKIVAMLDKGQAYKIMERYCKEQSDSISIYELDTTATVSSILTHIFTDKVIAVHTELVPVVHAFAEHAISHRGSLPLDQIANIDSGCMIIGDKAICLIGYTARTAFSGYVSDAAEKIKAASRPHHKRERTGTVAYGVPIVREEPPDTHAFDEKPTTLVGVAPVDAVAPLEEVIPLDKMKK